MQVDFCWYYVLAAPLGGFVGGLGHGLVSDNSFGKKLTADDPDRDYSGFRDLGIGLISGLVWLLPNQNLWVGTTFKASDVVRIALQTMIIGLAGSGWLTSYLNTNALKGAVVKAADANSNPAVSGQIAGAQSVNQIVSLVKQLNTPAQAQAPAPRPTPTPTPQ
jgi:hypothetical protein